MSAFAGNNLNFAITIGARDTSASTLRGVAQRYLSLAKTIAKPITIPIRMARRGMAFARDFELGLRPIIALTDRLIERGSGLEVVRKSFEALTDSGGKRAEMLARQMRDAASGTIRLGRAMEIANRGLASGLAFDQLITAMDFVSKKAITTGMSAEGAIDKVITGLARGSVLFLDDFGLVVDGLEGVAREYDKIHDAGAFDALGPAAQKAAIVNQAIKEMREQLGKIGVSGRESIFIWQGLKNQIGDSVDKLVLAVAKSESLKNSLTGFRNILSGVTKHLEEGGSLWDVYWGKKGDDGKRGTGLVDIGKSVLLDVGESIGRSILYCLLKGASKLLQIVGHLVDWADQKISALWTTIKTGAEKLWESVPGKIADGFEAGVERIKAALTEWMPSVFGEGGWLTSIRAQSETTGQVAEDAIASVTATPAPETPAACTWTPEDNPIQRAMGARAQKWEEKRFGPDILFGQPDLFEAPAIRIFEQPRGPNGQPIARGPIPSNPGLLAATLSMQSAIATTDSEGSLWRVLGRGIATAFTDALGGVFGTDARNVFGRMAGDIDKLAETVSHGGGFGGKGETRTQKAIIEFEKTFPPVDDTPQLGESYPLTQTSMFARTRRIQQLNREIRSLAGSMRLRRQARSEAIKKVEAERAKGRQVPNSEVHRLTKEILAKLIEDATGPLVAERDQLEAERAESKEISQRRRQQKKEERERRKIEQERRQIDRDWRESGRTATADDRGPMPADKSLGDLVKTARADALMKTMEAMLAQLSQVVTALNGASSQLAQSA